MIWWLARHNRLQSEKAAIAGLEASVDWLQIEKWQASDDLAMCVDFRVTVYGKVFNLRMIYPSVFPDAPPMIYTADKTRISLHQYGATGELCLEHRPDNWQPSISGADMIFSAQRLLSEERSQEGSVVHARSAHVASLGRDMRSKSFRFLVTEGDLVALNTLPEYKLEAFTLNDRTVASIFVSSLLYIGTKEQPLWKSSLVLPKGRTDEIGFVVRVPRVPDLGEPNADELRILLDKLNLVELRHMTLDTDSYTNLLIGDEQNWLLFCIFGKANDRKVIRYTTLVIPGEKQRLSESFSSLSDKKVGIVGCGSVGTKIAASLCRSGVGHFFLLDEDILFPGNVVRNELDLDYVGTHKAHALRERLLKINPLANINALRISLGGQESANSMSGALVSLGECDLLIDATADATAFNMIASVSTRRRKPMIWVEVFGGGIGGIVARTRPDIDPVPLSARAQVGIWCADQGMDWVRVPDTSRYDGQSEDGTPLIADDAEVSIMAAHAARFASDILARPEASVFPYSAYVVGLSSEWLFTAPFDTRPIDLKPNGEWGEADDTSEPEVLLQLLKEHLPPKEGTNAVITAE